MQTIATKIDAALEKNALPLQIVVAYDHPVMAGAARQLINGYLSKFAPETDTHCDEWSFVELENAQCASEALELAAPCDLFIIATAGAEELPHKFVTWLNAWLQSRQPIETALILCVAAGSQSHPALTFSFEALEHSTGITFLATSILVPEEKLPHSAMPKSLYQRLGCLNMESLPEASGLNE
jgi:hypothetical protein